MLVNGCQTNFLSAAVRSLVFHSLIGRLFLTYSPHAQERAVASAKAGPRQSGRRCSNHSSLWSRPIPHLDPLPLAKGEAANNASISSICSIAWVLIIARDRFQRLLDFASPHLGERIKVRGSGFLFSEKVAMVKQSLSDSPPLLAQECHRL
jgi:hypothetical protein